MAGTKSFFLADSALAMASNFSGPSYGIRDDSVVEGKQVFSFSIDNDPYCRYRLKMCGTFNKFAILCHVIKDGFLVGSFTLQCRTKDTDVKCKQCVSIIL